MGLPRDDNVIVAGSEQAHDRTGELNDAIPGGLDFLFANGINRNYDLSTMVKASAVGVMQEMMLRNHKSITS